MIYISYVAPCSTVKIYGGIKLEKSYQHTIYFGNVSDQTAFFENIAPIFTLTKSQYSRASKNSIKVQANVNNLLTANYMRFYNPRPNSTSPTSGKWFYAFVDSVEYVSETVTEIFYTIDVMQTWFVGCSVNPCMVEREHTNYDSLEFALIGEPFDNEFILNSNYYIDTVGYSHVGILLSGYDATHDVTPQPTTANLLPVGYKIEAYPLLGNEWMDRIDELVNNNQKDRIVGLFPLPDDILIGENSVSKLTKGTVVDKFYKVGETNLHSINLPSTLDGYTPVNKKMFGSQFNRIVVSNYSGETVMLAPEYCEFPLKFYRRASAYPMPETSLTPINYMRYGGMCLNATLYNRMPMGSTFYEQFNAYLSANKFSIATSVLAGVVGIATANPAAIAMSTVGLASTIGKLADKSTLPTALISKGEGSGINWAGDFYTGTTIDTHGMQNTYQIYFESINANQAKRIDTYLSRYGYNISSVKEPSINGFKYRKYFYFLKTNGATINGSIPADIENKIHEILDAGITFWSKNQYNVIGEYTETILENNVPQSQAQPW